MSIKNKKLKILMLFCICVCMLLTGILSVIQPFHREIAKAESEMVSPTEVKAQSNFDENGIYTSNYEINITFSSAFATCGDGNAAPTLYADLADKLMIGDKSLSDWWTLFSASQNNFTVQKWGNRLRLIFNEGLMHDTVKSTALDGTFVIQLTENVTNDLGVFKGFKYEMTPTKTDGVWTVVAEKVYTDSELENANRITANLTALDLKLCASAADHNLWFTFDQKAFAHDGVVASSGQIGVLANIKLNGKSLHEWYNFNSAGTLDTVAFYPQQDCFALVMQFKINRMETLFEKDPIYYGDLLIESEELVWEYYEGETLTIVTIPAFSYTYSQAHGAFFKTGEVPEKTNEPLKVKDVSPISTFKEGSGHTPGTQVFSIAFWDDVCGPTSIMYMPSYEEILDNVLLNGKTLRNIQETAVNKDGEAFPSGITVQMCGYMGASDKRIVIYLNGELADEFLFQKTEGETITVKAGFTSKLGAVVAEDVTFEYYQGGWRKVLDTSALEYTDLQVTSISRLQFIGDTINGKRAATFFIYFDRAVSLERLLYVGRNKENLVALKNQGALKVSEEKIYGIVDNHIGDYVLDYIKYDGKTLRETLQAEDTLAMQTWGIDIHYTGDTFDTKAIQITFNAEAKCLISDGNTHTFEIMEGFVSPLLGRTEKSYKFELQTDTNGWKNISVGVEGNYSELPKSDYVEPVETDSGCGSAISSMPLVVVMLAMGAVVVGRTRRMKDEE